MPNKHREDHYGTHRTVYLKNRKRIFATQEVCGICGRPVDFSLKYPHPMSACVDHIIPVSRGGHPSDIDNMQLAHFSCNRQKSNKMQGEMRTAEKPIISNRILPHSCDWVNF